MPAADEFTVRRERAFNVRGKLSFTAENEVRYGLALQAQFNRENALSPTTSGVWFSTVKLASR